MPEVYSCADCQACRSSSYFGILEGQEGHSEDEVKLKEWVKSK